MSKISSNPPSAILPGEAVLGVIGGGQLGQMFVHAAQRLGYFTAVLDPNADSLAGRVSHHHVHADYDDREAQVRFAGLVDAVTIEFENVPAAALTNLVGEVVLAPGAKAVAIAQDRVQEKQQFERSGVACAPYAVIESPEHLAAVPDKLLPGILKTARMGYDGKGQVSVADRAALALAWQGLGSVTCVLEQALPLAYECSVIVARGRAGQLVHLPVQRNLHRSGILAATEIYAGAVPEATAQAALAAAQTLANELDYVGVLCVEFFVLTDGTLVANEMAPRPHNSGHYSIEACDISQFELQVRTLAGLPLVPPRQARPAIMLNLLGDLWWPSGFDEGRDPVTPDWTQVLAMPGSALHLYGKLPPRPGRKMGHLTLLGDSAQEVRALALRACEALGIAPI